MSEANCAILKMFMLLKNATSDAVRMFSIIIGCSQKRYTRIFNEIHE